MSQKLPIVRDYMTPVPYTIQAGESLELALEIMQTNKIRHLPVVNDAAETIGLLAKRDVELVLAQEGSDARQLSVDSVMDQEPFVVPPEESIFEVASQLAEFHLSSALVIDDKGELLGICTEKDALRALAQIFHDKQFPKSWFA